ncbi:MAG: ABC transporter permease [Deltaproteobacteria bacterium]|nr:MAG: ABC transporter permease [Deltaproteobacteria bacterium]
MSSRGLTLFLGVAVAFAVTFVAGLLAVELGYARPGDLAAALKNGELRHAIFLSLTTATIAATLALLAALPVAYALARHQFPGSFFVDLLLDLPVVLSPVAVGVSLLLLLRTTPGRWIETHLISFIFETPGIVLAQFTVALALSIRVLKAAFQEVDVRYEQVSRFLGLNGWETLLKVTLPLAKRGILAAFILAWARSMGEFGATVTLAGAVAGKTETIPVAIYLRMASVDITGAVALIVLLSLFSLTALLMVRLLVRAR